MGHVTTFFVSKQGRSTFPGQSMAGKPNSMLDLCPVLTSAMMSVPQLPVFHRETPQVRTDSCPCMQDLAEYDAVVNCMGLRGATLFGDDSCYPIRGQVLRARAPWIKHHYVVDERFYVIPNNDLGGSPG